MAPGKPTVGRIVHFHADGEKFPQAAIVIHTEADTIRLSVMTPSGGRFVADLSDQENVMSDKGYSWCWPPRG